MASKQLVLAIFDSEAAADDAAEALKTWEKATDDIKLKSVGVLVLDDNGKIKVDKVGRRSTFKGAGIGVILAMATPIGMAAGIVGGAALGALHHKGLGIPNDERERIGRELAGGKAAVGVVSDSSETEVISNKLYKLGGSPETHDIDDAALAEVDTAAAAEPAAEERRPRRSRRRPPGRRANADMSGPTERGAAGGLPGSSGYRASLALRPFAKVRRDHRMAVKDIGVSPESFASVSTPDRVESRLGVLEFDDGAPTAATAALLYDNLDFTHAVEAYLGRPAGVSLEAIRRGFAVDRRRGR